MWSPGITYRGGGYFGRPKPNASVRRLVQGGVGQRYKRLEAEVNLPPGRSGAGCLDFLKFLFGFRAFTGPQLFPKNSAAEMLS